MDVFCMNSVPLLPSCDQSVLDLLPDFPSKPHGYCIQIQISPQKVDMASHDINNPNAWVPYRYDPTIVGAAIMLVAFILTTALHCYQAYRARAWSFIPLIIGGICMWKR